MKQRSIGKNGQEPQRAPFRFHFNAEPPLVLSGKLGQTCQLVKAHIG